MQRLIGAVVSVGSLGLALGVALCWACERGQPDLPLHKTSELPAPLTLTVAYGSEKKTWLEAEIQAFAATLPKTASGRTIRVVTSALGSGEIVQDLLAGRSQPHVFSPASGAYVALLNEAWRGRDDHLKPLAPAGEPLILSPLVIAMWSPMARALGWPERALGWKDIIAMEQEKAGWAAHGRPEWGRFKLGHTHPEYSNSGLLSVLAEAYAGAGKVRGLRAEDLARPEVKRFVAAVEQAVVHYGKSTGLFSEQMAAHGPAYLSAAVLYENLVVEARTKPAAGQPELVAVYPVEGTFWSDHPFCVLDAPWVSAEHRDAAQQLQAFLRAQPAQRRALALGFRPADLALAIDAPIDAAHGVDPKQPQTLLEVPSGATLNGLLALFGEVKKPSSVALLFDKSGSMRGEPLAQAKAGAVAFLEALGARDQASVTFFDHRVFPTIGPVVMDGGRATLEERVREVVAEGGTALYDATAFVHHEVAPRAKHDPRRIHALVLMTDGKDEDSQASEAMVMPRLSDEAGDRSIRVFTIAYGQYAEAPALERLAQAGGGSFSRGTVKDIVQVYRDIASFF